MENPDGAEQGTGRSGSRDSPAGGGDGSTQTSGPHLPLIPTGAALWTGPPPPRGPAGPPGNPASSTGQDHSSQGSQCHFPEFPTAAPRKGAFPVACGRAHPLCQAGPARHSCPKQCLSVPHSEQAPKQDFWIAGEKSQCLSQNYWLWTSQQTAGIQSQDSWSDEPNLQVPGPNPWIPEQDAWTLEWNSWTFPWALTQGPRSRRHPPRNFRHRLFATQPLAWIFSFPSPSSYWTVHPLLSPTHLPHPHGPAPSLAS
ncbi:thrombopoietin isoform X4 [Elephas maximus indicus]|uniref:thrombopoietin isoform X4 n=1 Tax=Elephas maximus indicus TaxID=99487 RepID=UPI002116BBE7|nr:thrombopoietin isoform X4 [Elephas maximus indicus]